MCEVSFTPAVQSKTPDGSTSDDVRSKLEAAAVADDACASKRVRGAALQKTKRTSRHLQTLTLSAPPRENVIYEHSRVSRRRRFRRRRRGHAGGQVRQGLGSQELHQVWHRRAEQANSAWRCAHGHQRKEHDAYGFGGSVSGVPLQLRPHPPAPSPTHALAAGASGPCRFHGQAAFPKVQPRAPPTPSPPPLTLGAEAAAARA